MKLVLPCSIAVVIFGLIQASYADQPISAAEQHLFLDNHLANVGNAKALKYTFQRSGSLESQISDQVQVKLGKKTQAGGRQTQVEFLTGERAVNLPAVESAKGNPVILSFLERDVREMQRLTKGQANYFRKRVRMALAESAKVDQTTIDVSGENLPAWRIRITPYLDDPMKPRFERYAGKTYSFIVSDRVPGGVYELRTVVKRGADAPLMEESLIFSGADK